MVVLFAFSNPACLRVQRVHGARTFSNGCMLGIAFFLVGRVVVRRGQLVCPALLLACSVDAAMCHCVPAECMNPLYVYKARCSCMSCSGLTGPLCRMRHIAQHAAG